jgi:Skp family chaperone for outer membrane proteins
MRRTALLLAAAATVILVICAPAGGLYAQEKKPAIKIGVVDLKKVSERFEKWLVFAKKLEDESNASNDKLAAMEKDIKKLQEMLKNFEPGSEKHTQIQIEISQKQITLRSYFEREQKRLKAMAEKMGAELLRNIEDVIKEYGRIHGYTLIIKKEDLPVQGRDWDQLRSYVSRKSVMYYDPNIDITDEIVKILNKKHKVKKENGAKKDQPQK